MNFNELKRKLEGFVANEIDTTVNEYIDTGHYGLNCLISGHPFKGLPTGKITQLAGEQSTGKTFISHLIIRKAQQMGYDVVIFDSEYAQDVDDLKAKKIDLNKLLIIPEGSIEKFRSKIVNLLDSLKEKDKVLIVIDSLGNFYTEKEYKDAVSGSDKADMTRAKILKSIFRLISVKAGKLQVPILLLNHVYADQSSFIKRNIVSGGGGSLYSSSSIIELRKAQDKNSKGRNIGVIITGKVIKSRTVKEKMECKININFEKGVNKFSGLLEYAIEGGFVKDLGRKTYEFDGEKYTLKTMDLKFWEKLFLNNKDFQDYLINTFSLGEIKDFDDNVIIEEDDESELLLENEDIKEGGK